MSDEYDTSHLLLPSAGGRVGREKSVDLGEGVTHYTDANGSHRLVYHENGTPVSAIQVMSRDGNSGHVTGAYTRPEYRRKGLGRKLINVARSRFGSLTYDVDRSKLGEKFVENVSRLSRRGIVKKYSEEWTNYANTEEAALKKAILDNPQDETALSAYADWLQENGKPHTGEMIQRHIEYKRENGKPVQVDLYNRPIDAGSRLAYYDTSGQEPRDLLTSVIPINGKHAYFQAWTPRDDTKRLIKGLESEGVPFQNREQHAWAGSERHYDGFTKELNTPQPPVQMSRMSFPSRKKYATEKPYSTKVTNVLDQQPEGVRWMKPVRSTTGTTWQRAKVNESLLPVLAGSRLAVVLHEIKDKFKHDKELTQLADNGLAGLYKTNGEDTFTKIRDKLLSHAKPISARLGLNPRESQRAKELAQNYNWHRVSNGLVLDGLVAEHLNNIASQRLKDRGEVFRSAHHVFGKGSGANARRGSEEQRQQLMNNLMTHLKSHKIGVDEQQVLNSMERLAYNEGAVSRLTKGTEPKEERTGSLASQKVGARNPLKPAWTPGKGKVNVNRGIESAQFKRRVVRYAQKLPSQEANTLSPEQYELAKQEAWAPLGDHLQENGMVNAGRVLSRVGTKDGRTDNWEQGISPLYANTKDGSVVYHNSEEGDHVLHIVKMRIGNKIYILRYRQPIQEMFSRRIRYGLLDSFRGKDMNVPVLEGIRHTSHPNGKYDSNSHMAAQAEYNALRHRLNHLKLIPSKKSGEGMTEYDARSNEDVKNWMSRLKQHVENNVNAPEAYDYLQAANRFQGGNVPMGILELSGKMDPLIKQMEGYEKPDTGKRDEQGLIDLNSAHDAPETMETGIPAPEENLPQALPINTPRQPRDIRKKMYQDIANHLEGGWSTVRDRNEWGGDTPDRSPLSQKEIDNSAVEMLKDKYMIPHKEAVAHVANYRKLKGKPAASQPTTKRVWPPVNRKWRRKYALSVTKPKSVVTIPVDFSDDDRKRLTPPPNVTTHTFDPSRDYTPRHQRPDETQGEQDYHSRIWNHAFRIAQPKVGLLGRHFEGKVPQEETHRILANHIANAIKMHLGGSEDNTIYHFEHKLPSGQSKRVRIVVKGKSPRFDAYRPKMSRRGLVKRYTVGENDINSMLQQLMRPDNQRHRSGQDDPLHGVRGPLADALEENGRTREAELLRSPNQHVMGHGGKIVPARWTSNPMDAGRRIWVLNHEPTYREWIKQGGDVEAGDPLEDGFVARNRFAIDTAMGQEMSANPGPAEEPDTSHPFFSQETPTQPEKLSRFFHLRRYRANPIVGGVGDKTEVKDVSKRALRKGVKVEKEHTPKSEVAKDIAIDHLTERPDYYDKLAEMEKEPIKNAAYRAPAGGMIARGTHYTGGQMIPSMEGDFMKGGTVVPSTPTGPPKPKKRKPKFDPARLAKIRAKMSKIST